ncbi:MAG: alpha/beta fold hydrolase [Verrucomicrobiota bacterium JB022]|nr:alpha/beta fold hydrolase [Verrucomicrobiota bacterium JB022]
MLPPEDVTHLEPIRADALPVSIRALYPFDGKLYLLTNGHCLHYVDEGSGPPILMLHGNPTWSFYYRNLVLGLRDQFRCIVPDHLGCGFSDKPQDFNYRLDAHIQHVEELVDHLRLDRVHLVVHDWGGAIGMGFATRHPDRVGRITVLNTAAFHLPSIPRRIALCRHPFWGGPLVRGLNGFAWPATFMTTVQPLAEQVKRGYLFPYRNWHDRVAIHRFVQDIPLEADHPSRPDLQRIEQGLEFLSRSDLQILWGGQDWCFHDGFYDEWCRRFPRAPTQYWADAGHYVLEDKASEVLERVRSFVEADERPGVTPYR